VEGGIPVPPHFEPLDRAYALDFAEAISAAVDVGPYDVDVEEVDEISSAKIALELDGSFHGGEFVSNLDVLIVDANTLICRVAYSVWLGKGQVSFHI
jgi:hypothetical protein